MSSRKLINQRRHAKRRAMERYNVQLNRGQLKEIVGLIHTQKAKFIVRGSHRITFWSVPYNGTKMIAIYDSTRHTVVTFLPPTLTEEDIIREVKGGEIDLNTLINKETFENGKKEDGSGNEECGTLVHDNAGS